MLPVVPGPEKGNRGAFRYCQIVLTLRISGVQNFNFLFGHTRSSKRASNRSPANVGAHRTPWTHITQTWRAGGRGNKSVHIGMYIPKLQVDT